MVSKTVAADSRCRTSFPLLMKVHSRATTTAAAAAGTGVAQAHQIYRVALQRVLSL